MPGGEGVGVPPGIKCHICIVHAHRMSIIICGSRCCFRKTPIFFQNPNPHFWGPLVDPPENVLCTLRHLNSYFVSRALEMFTRKRRVLTWKLR